MIEQCWRVGQRSNSIRQKIANLQTKTISFAKETPCDAHARVGVQLHTRNTCGPQGFEFASLFELVLHRKSATDSFKDGTTAHVTSNGCRCWDQIASIVTLRSHAGATTISTGENKHPQVTDSVWQRSQRQHEHTETQTSGLLADRACRLGHIDQEASLEVR